jgi:recombination endonuclease VII
MKRCKHCGDLRLLDLFYRDSGAADGHRPECKECTRRRRQAWYEANREREISRVRQWQVENADRRRLYMEEYARSGKKKEKDRASYLKRALGLTPEEYEAVFARQDGMCAICERRPAIHMDHDHATGRVRGALCFGCNGGLGQFCDDPDLLRRAIDYLERHRAS